MANKTNNTKVVTGIVRLSYEHVWEPASINGSNPKYSVSLIIPKDDVKTIAAINQAVDNAIKDGAAKFGGKIPPKGALKLPLRDGDTERDDEAYRNAYFVNANSTTAPQIVDRAVQPMPYKQFLGYEKGPDGLPKIVPEQAETVRYIYDLFMSGKTITAIAKQLTAEGIPTPGGKEKWVGRTVESILTNEKYKGDARLQKKFTVDFLQKKMKVNEGEVPQYYVENSHEAIIDPLLFDRVQEEMARRKALGRSYSGKTIFSCRLICGDCGHYLGSKVWNSTNKYRRVIWQCNNKFKGECKCGTPHLTEEFIKAKFLEAYNQLLPDRERLIEDCRVIQAALTDCTDIDREMQQLLEELEVVAELTKRCVDENSSTALDQGDYLARYNGLVERYEKAQERVKELERKRTERMAKADAIGGFMFRLREMDQPMEHFDERLWLDVIDRVVVHRDGLTFKFQNGKEIRV